MSKFSALIFSNEPRDHTAWDALETELQCQPLVVSSLPRAFEAVRELVPDIILVDVDSRITNGLEICSALRQRATNPIMLLTPVDDEPHRAAAFQVGVDDYIVKPIGPDLLAAKASIWLHRARRAGTGDLRKPVAGNLALEEAPPGLLFAGGRKVKLSKNEFRALQALLEHPNQPCSTDRLIEHVWGPAGGGDVILAKNLIYRLRRKIEAQPDLVCRIESVAGGYQLNL